MSEIRSDGGDLSRRIPNLSPEKLDLLARKIKRRNDGSAQSQQISKRPQSSSLPPLSWAQERLWFLHQMEPASPAYNAPGGSKFDGELNVCALEQALSEVLRRHEILRSTFQSIEGSPAQVISPARPQLLPVVDLSELTEVERRAEGNRVADEQALRPISLAQQPLLQVTLLRLSEHEHLVLNTIHHIIWDAWSWELFSNEIVVLYNAFSRSHPSPLTELPIQFADYAVWQRDWMKGEVLERQLSYWKQRLAGIRPLLEMPTDRPRSAFYGSEGGTDQRVLSKRLTERLKELSQREGVTLFVTLLAAFKVLLHRYSGLTDIVVGTPFAGRNRKETEKLIGLFLNTLVLRTDVSGDPSFREVLRRVSEVTTGAIANQDVPFEKLVQELQPSRNRSNTPLFQVSFTFVIEGAPKEALSMPGVSVTPIVSGVTRAKFDLTLATLLETSDSLTASIEYNKALFDSPTSGRMLDRFQIILERIVENPDDKIRSLADLSDWERHQVLIEWNATEHDNGRETCVHERFEEQAKQSPDSIAIVCDEKHISYSELNRRANQLARYLRSLGVGPEELVAIYAEHSFEMMLAVMGVLKAGAGYIPLDPGIPMERIGFVLDESHANVLLTQERLGLSLEEYRGTVVSLEAIRDVLAQEADNNLINPATADNIVYVMYTSGSTGMPKGVMIPHRGAVNYLAWCAKAYNVDQGQASLLHSPIGFDLSVTSMFAPLMAGGRVEILTDRRGIEVLTHALSSGKDYGLLKVTPAHLELMNQILAEDRLTANVRTLVIGGEALYGESLRYWQEISKDTRLINEYGPTETVVGCVVYEVGREETVAGSVSIGRPIWNTDVYILDDHLQEVGIAVAGEVYISGEGLARGYLKRGDQTAESFVPNPFGEHPGRRMYRTGDFAKYSADGQIKYLGRKDQQVKVRGFRIELGEIESALNAHESVSEAVVVVSDDEGGDKRLVAYVQVERGSDLNARELKTYIKERLPDYMVPPAIVMLEALPLTANGKVDHKALPSPDYTRQLETEFIAPRTEAERIVAGIWRETLKVEKIGIHDNFFDLGGHSLLLIDVHRRVTERFEQDLSIVTLFEYPTVNLLAEYLVTAGRGKGDLRRPEDDSAKLERGKDRLRQQFNQSRMAAAELQEVGSETQ